VLLIDSSEGCDQTLDDPTSRKKHVGAEAGTRPVRLGRATIALPSVKN